MDKCVKQKNKGKTKWYRKSGKAKRAAKRARCIEQENCHPEDCVSGSDDYPQRNIRRAFTHEQVESIRDIIWEEQLKPKENSFVRRLYAVWGHSG